MNMEKMTHNGKTVAVITSDDKVMNDAQLPLDLIITAKYDVDTNLITIDKDALSHLTLAK